MEPVDGRRGQLAYTTFAWRRATVSVSLRFCLTAELFNWFDYELFDLYG